VWCNADRRCALDLFFPAQTLPLLQVFAPCFPAPSFAYVQSDVGALLVVEGRTCLPRRARCACGQQRARSRGERFLAGPRGSVTAVTERLGPRVVERWGTPLQVHGASLVGQDTTWGAQSAKRRLGGQKWKAPSDTADRGASLVGHHWTLAGLRSRWDTRWLCWPVVLRLVPGRQGARQWLVGDTSARMSCWDAALATVLEGTRCWGDVSVRVGAEAYDSQAPFRHGLRARGLDGLSRLRQAAVGWDDPAPREPGTRGRQPRSGRQGPWAPLQGEVF
jgi:hypothetical protein